MVDLRDSIPLQTVRDDINRWTNTSVIEDKKGRRRTTSIPRRDQKKVVDLKDKKIVEFKDLTRSEVLKRVKIDLDAYEQRPK